MSQNDDKTELIEALMLEDLNVNYDTRSRRFLYINTNLILPNLSTELNLVEILQNLIAKMKPTHAFVTKICGSSKIFGIKDQWYDIGEFVDSRTNWRDNTKRNPARIKLIYRLEEYNKIKD